MDEFVDIEALCPDVPLKFLPSRFQHSMWGRFVVFADGADPDGNFNGHCPLHDLGGDPERPPSATFNFKSGALRCQGEPSCHKGKRAMSLVNVQIAMASRS
jgi:hypothetical protein